MGSRAQRPFFAIAAALTLVNIWFQSHGSQEAIRNVTFGQRMLGAGAVVWFYFYKALWPFTLAFIYPQWTIEVGQLRWWLPLFAALGVTGMLWWRRRTRFGKPLFAAWCFFVVSLLPVMGLIDIGFMKHSLVSDHYLYTALVGIVALAAAAWTYWWRTALKAADLARRPGTHRGMRIHRSIASRKSALYVNAITLYENALRENPKSSLLHNNLGLQLYALGRFPEASDHFRRVLQLQPDNAEALNNLGLSLASVGRHQEARDNYERALSINYNSHHAHHNLAMLAAKTGQNDEAIRHYREALKLRPDDSLSHLQLGDVLANVDQPQAAMEHYREAARLEPNDPEVHKRLADALAKSGQFPEAIEHYGQAMRLKPDDHVMQNNLAKALLQVNQPQVAIEVLQNALRLKPDHAAVHNNLGLAFRQQGQWPQALAQFQQALIQQPDYADAWANLAVASAQVNQPAAALAAGQKALEFARAQGQSTLAQQIESWLNSYCASQSKSADNDTKSPDPKRFRP